jgi:hypothetical protein
VTLPKWVIDDIRKLTYILRVEHKGGGVYFYYDKDGVEKFKKLQLRSNRDDVVNMLADIRMDIQYDERRVVIRDVQTKPSFLIAGEEYGERHEDNPSSNS